VIPDANVESLDTLRVDATSVQGPPRSGIVSTVPASATTTKERVPDTFFLPSSLFSAGPGVFVDMAYYKPAEPPLLRLAKTVAATGR
jgi:pentafunctional AROM polypeptide